MKFQRYRIIASACIAACGKPTAPESPDESTYGQTNKPDSTPMFPGSIKRATVKRTIINTM
jgi:hypothetical protein